jgi:hypothetical protein
LYGIASADANAETFPGGVCGGSVKTLVEGRLAAVVSRIETDRLRPQRANIAAHHRVLQDLAARASVLPVVFGTVVFSDDDLREFLRSNHDSLSALLERLAGKVELGLKVYWDTPNIFDYFVATHQELAQMRNRLFQPGRVATMDEKVALGETFASLLQQARQRHTDRVRQALAPYCVEIRSVSPGDEQMIMKLACLVEKDRRQQWEEGVQRAAALFDDHYRFDCNGPWPPFNFVDIDARLP